MNLTSTRSPQKRRQETLMARDALQQYLDREEFSFDLNGDALYQQYKNSYVNQGKRAMEHSVGQAAALTGGYGNSYAQSVGQQSYNAYLEKLAETVPDIYEAAYSRYRQEGQDLYDRYAALAQQEEQEYQRQQDALQAQWQREELAYRKQRDAIEDDRYEREFRQSVERYQKENGGTGYYADYQSFLGSYQGKGSMLDETGSTMTYNNGQLSTGNIMTLQRVLGLKADGLWKSSDVAASGGMMANQAWAAYQRGALSYRSGNDAGKTQADTGNIRTLERIMGVPEDGVWSELDKAAAGGMSFFEAWQAYRQGQFQYR